MAIYAHLFRLPFRYLILTEQIMVPTRSSSAGESKPKPQQINTPAIAAVASIIIIISAIIIAY